MRWHFTDIDILAITREASGNGWRYYDASETGVNNRAEIDRLNAIASPPAYQAARFPGDPSQGGGGREAWQWSRNGSNREGRVLFAFPERVMKQRAGRN